MSTMSDLRSLVNDSSLNMSTMVTQCSSDFLRQYSQYSLISQVGLIAIVSAFITAATCFMQRRNRYQKCCSGFPGLPSPMDFLVTPRHRWVYVALFFVMAASLINTYGSLNGFNVQNVYFNIFYSIIILPVIVITVMSIQFFPLFACVDAAPFPVSTLAHALGLLYSVIWLGGVVAYETNTYLQYVRCNEDGVVVISSTTLLSAAIAGDTPLFFTGVFIVLWYLYHFVADIVKVFFVQRNVDIDDVVWVNRFKQLFRLKRKSPKADMVLSGMKCYHMEHVRCLLVKPPPNKDYGEFMKFFVKMFKYFFPYNRYDRLPVPYLGSVAAVTMLLYQLSLRLLAWGSILINVFSVTYTQEIRPALNLNGTIDDVLSTLTVGFPIVIIVSPFVSSLLVLILIVHMTAAVSKDLKRVSKYGISEKLPSTLSIVPGMWKYIGIQIGYALSAWIIYTLIAMVVGLAIALIYICIILFTDWVISITLALLIPFLFPKVIYYTQYLICRYVFFEDREGKFISITNRRLFNWFAFILFFYNGIAGIFGAILRAFMSFLFGLLLLFRLDRIVLMKGFEAYDFDHRKYLGFLYLYSTYNNAVVHVFIRLLVNSSNNWKADRLAAEIATPDITSDEDKRTSDDDIKGTSIDIELIEVEPVDSHSHIQSCTGRQIKNRWLVAYTLVQNPSLVPLTATNLQIKQSEKATSTKSVGGRGNNSPQSGSNQHSTQEPSHFDSESSPVIVHQSRSNSDMIAEDTNMVECQNDSQGTVQCPLVVTTDDNLRIDPASEATNYQIVEPESAEIAKSQSPLNANLAKMKSSEPELVLKLTENEIEAEPNCSNSGLISLESAEHKSALKTESHSMDDLLPLNS